MFRGAVDSIMTFWGSQVPARHERTLWEPVGTIFVLRWQKYPRHTSIICTELHVAPGSYNHPDPKLFSEFNLAKTAFLIEGCGRGGIKKNVKKETEWRKMTLHFLFRLMASAAWLLHLLASINYTINHVISRGNLQRVSNAGLQALKWGQ